MSAESANAAFSLVAEKLPRTGGAKDRVILATVEGDIHDIGKNIVKLLLENYGYEVIDLGKDVSPEAIAAAAKKTGAPLVGLSALMTTTVPAMRETIRLLRETAPGCKVMVGGAVLPEDYAKEIGADFYGRDAMATVRIAESLTTA
jgi:5-methyltetrahydrofolate--homocysteine methyltransferase